MIQELPRQASMVLAATCPHGKLDSELSSLGFVPLRVETPEALVESLEQRATETTIVFLTSETLASSEDSLFQLATSRGQSSPHIFLLERSTGCKLAESKWLSLPNCELLPKKLSASVLRERVFRAQALADERSTNSDIQLVYERYAKFIDAIAEERARQLVQAERLSTLGVMAAGIAHEFNTPLSYISTSLATVQVLCSDLLSEAAAPDSVQLKKLQERLPRALERIGHGLTRLQRMSSSLKNFGSDRPQLRTQAHIASILDDALELASIESSRRITVTRELPEQLPFIYVNVQEIEQVLINLLVNASHALEGMADAQIKISASLNNNMLEVFIEDNGPGIPAEKQESIWMPFFTTKSAGKGTGLGLYICKGIIQKHSGSLSYYQAHPAGAGFKISLPVFTGTEHSADR
jgi:C4-dicarboxylate-specific signal transduction histidine kinase